MTIRIEPNTFGKDVIWTEVDGRPSALPAEHIMIRASDGHVFTAPVGLRGLARLGPHEVGMVEHFIKEKGVAAPNIFAGDSN